MFGKIRNRLKDVFSKTEEIIEEEAELEKIDEEVRELDKLEEEIEEEIQEIEEDAQESVVEDKKKSKKKTTKGDKKRNKKKGEEKIEEDESDIDRLDDELESEIQEIEDEIEEGDIEKDDIEDVQGDDLEVSKKKKGFFSSIFGGKKSEEKEIEQENDENNENIEKSDGDSDEEDAKGEESDKDSKVSEKSKGFFKNAFSGITQKKISQNDFNTLWVDLELFLLEINIAYEIVEQIKQSLQEAIVDEKFSRLSLRQKTKEVLISEISSILKSRESDFLSVIDQFLEEKKPVCIMMLGVNGTGKTTTIGKVIHYFQSQNKSVVVAAADTFRAAAVEQVKEHCDNLGVKCVSHNQGADPASVAYDAIEHAKAKNIDIVLIDTAGRMPNNSNLMEELKKIKRVSQADEVLFIGDSISGNDLMYQIDLFDKGLGVSGVILTKVDTDERPGSVVTTAYSIHTPIYFLGCGQNYEDLIPFESEEIAKQLFNDE